MMKPILHFANLVHDEQDNDLEHNRISHIGESDTAYITTTDNGWKPATDKMWTALPCSESQNYFRLSVYDCGCNESFCIIFLRTMRATQTAYYWLNDFKRNFVDSCGNICWLFQSYVLCCKIWKKKNYLHRSSSLNWDVSIGSTVWTNFQILNDQVTAITKQGDNQRGGG